MSHDSRAVVFDLDDTLYPRRRFVHSGFGAVAAALAAQGIDRDLVKRILTHAHEGGWRGRELQVLLRTLGLPAEWLPILVNVIRAHSPEIYLPAETLAALKALRPGWQLGIVTNGLPQVQWRKIRALGLHRVIDAVVYAAEYGSGAGKPEPDGFLAVASRLEVAPERTVVVGDDARCDVGGAAAAGMWTVLFRPTDSAGSTEPVTADATIASLLDVPMVADRLLSASRRRHVA